jgi:hypothetical protein
VAESFAEVFGLEARVAPSEIVNAAVR